MQSLWITMKFIQLKIHTEGKYDISENPQTGEVNIKCDKSGGALVEKEGNLKL